MTASDMRCCLSHEYLDCLLPDGRVRVCEAVDNVRENLGVDGGFVQVLDKLLHLRQIKPCQSL